VRNQTAQELFISPVSAKLIGLSFYVLNCLAEMTLIAAGFNAEDVTCDSLGWSEAQPQESTPPTITL
jgi:hypothetical protein